MRTRRYSTVSHNHEATSRAEDTIPLLPVPAPSAAYQALLTLYDTPNVA